MEKLDFNHIAERLQWWLKYGNPSTNEKKIEKLLNLVFVWSP